jgi:3-phosphoshikimate 1-carboxyvinyltransferase
VRLEGVRPDSRQGDRRFVDLLLEMGARVEVAGGAVTVAGGSSGLRGIEVDLADLPDQVPTLAALASFAAGTTTIRNVPHLRLKESDRLRVMGRELRRLGAAVEERPDGLVVEGVWASAPPPADPVTVDPHGDHRIAMSLALVGLRRPGVSVADPGVVAKSYPGFWRDLERLTSR